MCVELFGVFPYFLFDACKVYNEIPCFVPDTGNWCLLSLLSLSVMLAVCLLYWSFQRTSPLFSPYYSKGGSLGPHLAFADVDVGESHSFFWGVWLEHSHYCLNLFCPSGLLLPGFLANNKRQQAFPGLQVWINETKRKSRELTIMAFLGSLGS